MPAHPLAIALIERLAPVKNRLQACVLDLGAGRGRNTAALERAGFNVISVADEAAASNHAIAAIAVNLDAVLATHALLHGTPKSVAERLEAIARHLVSRGVFYATFASTRDARYGAGRRVADNCFAPTEGDEAGVPHVYYDERRLRATLAPHFEIESLEERSVDDVAGRWAHPTTPLSGAVHWFVRGSRA
jgi:hypothetical protein